MHNSTWQGGYPSSIFSHHFPAYPILEPLEISLPCICENIGCSFSFLISQHSAFKHVLLAWNTCCSPMSQVSFWRRALAQATPAWRFSRVFTRLTPSPQVSAQMPSSECSLPGPQVWSGSPRTPPPLLSPLHLIPAWHCHDNVVFLICFLCQNVSSTEARILSRSLYL